MAKMFITMLLMIILFLGGVLFGIDQASEGVVETRGYTDETVKGAVETGEVVDGKYEVDVMGQGFQQMDIEEKEQEYQQVESGHFTQKLASTLELGVKWFYNQMIHSAYQLIQAFF